MDVDRSWRFYLGTGGIRRVDDDLLPWVSKHSVDGAASRAVIPGKRDPTGIKSVEFRFI